MDCIVYGVKKSWTRLSNSHFQLTLSLHKDPMMLDSDHLDVMYKETACNAEDPVLIPGLGRSAGEGLGYPLQYSWASLVAQLVKNPPAMWETWV